MVTIEISTPALETPEDLSRILRRAVAALGLEVAIERSMAKPAGSRHWHLKKPGRSGTLEVTTLPDGTRWWVCYHDNRVGDGWVRELAQPLADRILNEVRQAHGGDDRL